MISITSKSQGKAFGQQQSNFFQYPEDNNWCFQLTLRKFLKDLFSTLCLFFLQEIYREVSFLYSMADAFFN